MAGYQPDSDSTRMATQLNSTARYIMSQAFAPSTTVTYRRAANLYQIFCTKTGKSFPFYPLNFQDAIQFIAFLFQCKLSANSISTYLAAIATINKLHRGVDIFGSFVIKKLLAGVHRIRGSIDMRLPIQIDLLHALVDSTTHVVATLYMQLLLKAIYLLAFHAFLRIGEITAKNESDATRPLQWKDVAFQPASNPSSCVITLRETKNSVSSQAIHLRAAAVSQPNRCPVAAMNHFQRMRGPQAGMFFILPDKRAFTKHAFNAMLARSIAWVGLDASRYKAHSFRIGAATTAALQGIGDDKIQLLGRWRSSAFRKYIRISQLKAN